MQCQHSDTSMDFIKSLCGEFQKHNQIDPAYYEKYDVKRGLRNADGTGVMAGVTQIGNVLGYYVQDGERNPMEGRLIYRGIDVNDLVDGFMSEDRFGFEDGLPPSLRRSAHPGAAGAFQGGALRPPGPAQYVYRGYDFKGPQRRRDEQAGPGRAGALLLR